MIGIIEINQVSPDRPDVLALIEALDAYYHRVYQPEHIHVLEIASLLQPDIYFLAAELDGTAIGCGGFRRENGYAEIKRMYVDPAHRRRHVAARLLTALEEQIRRERYRLIRLESGDVQTEALHFYEKMGYHSIPPFVEYPDDPHALFFEKVLV